MESLENNIKKVDVKRKETSENETSSSSEDDVGKLKSKKRAKKSSFEKKKRTKNESAEASSSKMIGPVLPSTMIGPSLPLSLAKSGPPLIGPTLPKDRTIIGPAMPESRTPTVSAKDPDPNKQRNFTPMTKEEWEKRQSIVRRVYDEVWKTHLLLQRKVIQSRWTLM